jgi:hypothetical protein
VQRLLLVAATLSAACTAPGDDGDPSIGNLAGQIKILNGAPTEAIVYNPLLAGVDANRALTEMPLADKSFDRDAGHPALKLPLHDEAARTFMRYLVSCALDPDQIVTWTDAWVPAQPTYTFQGKLGLCPEWGKEAPSPGCLEVVSACVLARNNAFGREVPISLRGATDRGPLAVGGDEKQYLIREGAFYGTLFDSAALAVDLVVDPVTLQTLGVPAPGSEPGVIYPNMFSCSAAGWLRPEAYVRSRVCATPEREVSCAAAYGGPCEVDPWGSGPPGSLPPPAPAAVCEETDHEDGGDGDFGKCWGGSRAGPWTRPLTVFLEHADDLVPGKVAQRHPNADLPLLPPKSGK